MIRYLLITEDGELQECRAASWRRAIEDVGPEGWDKTLLHSKRGSRPDLAAFVNDIGLTPWSPYRRNMTATCFMIALGAGAQPYAGPVVITGWHESFSDAEVRSLDDGEVAASRELHAAVRYALTGAGEAPLSCHLGPSWQAAVRRVAELLEAVPAPGLRVLSGDDAWPYLLGDRS